MTIQELSEIKQKNLINVALRSENKDCIKIKVSVGESGLTNGARDVVKTFQSLIIAKNLQNVELFQCDNATMVEFEPTVEVIKDGVSTIYVNMDSQKAAEVVCQHIIDSKVLTQYTINS